MTPLEQEHLYLPGEIAAMFKVGKTTVTRWFNSGKIPPQYLVTTPGGHHRVKASYIDQLLRGEGES